MILVLSHGARQCPAAVGAGNGRAIMRDGRLLLTPTLRGKEAADKPNGQQLTVARI
jgi:hypothetical protein